MEPREGADYPLKLLRVDLSGERIEEELLGGDEARKYVGGTGLGTKLLYEEVSPGVAWSDPANRVSFCTGPLAGTKVAGSGTFSVVTKGPMTKLAAATQANGFFGAFLRAAGYHGIVVHGAARTWKRLHLGGGTAELRDAEDLVGKDTWETEDAVRRAVGKRCSVFGIGPAGEALVRFAALVGDRGHVAAHNGVGAVLGSKKLKAISVEPTRRAVPVREPARLAEAAKRLFAHAKASDPGLVQWGTGFAFSVLDKLGMLPIRNYTSSRFPEAEKFAGQYTRTHFKLKPAPCHACRMGHCNEVEVTEGPYKGFVGDEAEYEAMAAMGPLIGQTDPGAAVWLSNLIDRLGMDVNETGYLIGWLMECYEKGYLKKTHLDGVEMTWGNVDAVARILRKIANREGCGALFAEGVKHAAETVGGDAQLCAVYTQKGASPRGHDHRANWAELIDTCFSNTGTIESTGGPAQPGPLGLEPIKDRFDGLQVSTQNARLNGRRQFEDSLGVCRFCMWDFDLALECLNAATGWDFTIPEAMGVGRRIVQQLRLFNLRHGLRIETEAPSARYGSVPADGPAAGRSIGPEWETIRRNYYELMGWDGQGRPLPETLRAVGLGHLVRDLEGW